MSKIDDWKAARECAREVEQQAQAMLKPEGAERHVSITYAGVEYKGVTRSMEFRLWRPDLPANPANLGKYLAKAIQDSMSDLLDMAKAFAVAEAMDAGHAAHAEARSFLESGEVPAFLQQVKDEMQADNETGT
jgi:hypothetical protein